MFQELLYAILGPWGRAVIEWLLAHPAVLGSTLLVWLLLILWSEQSLRSVQSRTSAMALDVAREALFRDPDLNAGRIYDQLYPQWCDMVRKTARIIPHRWGLWPLPATPSNVRNRIGFTPRWLWGHLVANGVRPSGAAPETSQTTESPNNAPRDKKMRKR